MELSQNGTDGECSVLKDIIVYTRVFKHSAACFDAFSIQCLLHVLVFNHHADENEYNC